MKPYNAPRADISPLLLQKTLLVQSRMPVNENGDRQINAW